MSITTAFIPDVATTVYTSSGNTAITFMSLTNYDVSPVDVSVWIVPSGDSNDNTNLVLKDLAITADDTYQFYSGGEKLLLNNGDSVVAIASSSDSTVAGVNIVVSYTSI